jgi:V/A-type H+-transporting ATPase subunit E
MAPVEENIEMLTQAVMSEAHDEAARVLTEARAKAEGIRKQAQIQAAAEREAILGRAATEAERSQRQAVVSAQMKARMLELHQREKRLKDVFDAAEQKLVSVQTWKDYDEIAVQLAREALIHLGSKSAQIHADARTKHALTRVALEKLSKELEMKITVNEPLDRGIGVIVRTEDGRMQYDNTLETRLVRLQSTLRSSVYHILMGEAL